MKTKLKKLIRAWVLLALLLIVFSFVVEKTDFFYGFFIFAFAISAVFIIFGWDKYITYGDDDSYSSSKATYDDADDFWE